MMHQPGPKTKHDLRRWYRGMRFELDAVQCAVWSKDMTTALLNRLREISFDGVLYLYAPLPGEPDFLSFMGQVRYQVALPRTLADGRMTFHLWQSSDVAEVGSLSIRSPSSDSIEVMPRAGDVVVVPAICIDSSGFRLGFGGGYYDRWLAEFRSKFAFIAGSVFPPFKVSEPLPREEHDIPVDFCI